MKLKAALRALAALSQETRLRVFRLLVQTGPDGLQAGRIAERLAVTPATLSFHFKELEHAGLITARRAGREIFYAADFAGMAALITFLTENCCDGRPEICALLPADLFAAKPKTQWGHPR